MSPTSLAVSGTLPATAPRMERKKRQTKMSTRTPPEGAGDRPWWDGGRRNEFGRQVPPYLRLARQADALVWLIEGDDEFAESFHTDIAEVAEGGIGHGRAGEFVAA